MTSFNTPPVCTRHIERVCRPRPRHHVSARLAQSGCGMWIEIWKSKKPSTLDHSYFSCCDVEDTWKFSSKGLDEKVGEGSGTDLYLGVSENNEIGDPNTVP